MARKGPVAINTDAVALGLAQIRIGASLANIASTDAILTASDSIGSLANTRFVGNTDWYKLEGGFPLLEEYTTPIRESAQLECAFRETTPANLALAYGYDPAALPYSGYEAHSGEVPLGGRSAPAYVRMEAIYTYPNGTSHMYIIAPRAQVSASAEMDFAEEDAAAVPIVIEFKRADSELASGGHAVWDDRPLGRIYWD